MARAFFAFSVIILLLSACTQRLVCPAYQSAFIYDKEELRKKFSYFQEDSTPKVFTASKNKYLIAEPVSYRKKIRSMQTIPMKPVNVTLPDSFNIGEPGEDGIVPGAELDLAARSVIDSVYIEDVDQEEPLDAEDSVYVISVDKELRLLKYNMPDSLIFDPATGRYVPQKPQYVVTQVTFNVEQDNYMWYLRDYLVLPDVRLAKETNAAAAKAAKKAKKKGGFFKNLFKRKDKKATSDSTAVQAAPQSDDDFDYIDEDEQQQTQAPAEQPQEKKGFFSFLKKKEKDPQPEGSMLPEEEKPAKKRKEKKSKVKEEETEPVEEKKEDADDGF